MSLFFTFPYYIMRPIIHHRFAIQDRTINYQVSCEK